MATTAYIDFSEAEKAVKGSVRYKRIKWGIFLIGVSVFAQLYNYQPLLSEITQFFAVTPAESSYLVSASTFGMAIGLLLFAFIADRYPRKDIMLFSLVTSTLLTLLSVFVYDFALLININFLKGICISGVSAVTLAYLAEEIDSKSIGTAISFYLAGNTFGGMFGRIIAALVSGWFNWQIAVLTIGLLAFSIAIVFYYLFPESQFFQPQKVKFNKKMRQMQSIFRNKKILAMYVVGICLMGTFVSIYNYLGFKLEAPPYSLPHYIIALIFLMYAFGIVGNLVAGRLSDRYAAKNILLLALGLLLLGLGLMYIANLVVILLGLTIFTVAFFSGHTIASRVVTQLGGKAKSSATALYWFFYYMGSTLIGSSTGFFINNDNWGGFFITLVILASLALLSTYATTRSRTAK
ncbi:MFS transporter [Myroides sp. TSA_177.3]|uniref:MFS transporter n=1 Tax=Myroides sp. TSA_177.3 TaxID=3415650 RepID=UPI0040458329